MTTHAHYSIAVAVAFLGLAAYSGIAEDGGSAKGGAAKLLEVNRGRATADGTTLKSLLSSAGNPVLLQARGNAKGGATRLVKLPEITSGSGAIAPEPAAGIAHRSVPSQVKGSAKGGATRLLDLGKEPDQPEFQIAPAK